MLNVAGESVSSITVWVIVNQIGKYDFYGGPVLKSLKDRKLFSDHINRNHLTQCLIGVNLRFTNSVLNEII